MLLNAARSGDVRIVKGSLRRGASADTAESEAGKPALVVALEYAQHEVARHLLTHGANASASAYDGHTALHVACAKWDVEGVRLLLAAGASTTALDGDGFTPEQAALKWKEEFKPSAPVESELLRMLHSGRPFADDKL